MTNLSNNGQRFAKPLDLTHVLALQLESTTRITRPGTCGNNDRCQIPGELKNVGPTDFDRDGGSDVPRRTATTAAHRVIAIAAAVTLVAVIPNDARAIGSRTPNQDPDAIARGNAFVATADNPSALYYNPAGITQLQGHNVEAGALFYLDIFADYETPSGQRVKNDRSVVTIPHLDYTFTPKDLPFSFGLGFYAPFGLEMEWPENAPFRTSGIEAKVSYLTINPVVAYKPFESLSIAIGPTINYSAAKLRQGIAPPPAPYELAFDGDAWSPGFNAGILWQPHPQWSFGAKYFSATTFDYDGVASFNPAAQFLPPPFKTKGHLDFPQIVTGGVSFRPTTNWNIEVDIDWTDWDTVKTAPIDRVGALQLHWQSSFLYELGATRYFSKGYFVSAGFFYSEASTPERYYTPLVPDTDLYVLSLGIGQKGKHWSWSLAHQEIWGYFRTVSHAIDPSVNGRYKLYTPSISFSVGYHF